MGRARLMQPVRRKLAGVTIAYLFGAGLSVLWTFPLPVIGTFCALLFAVAAIWRLRQRKSAFCILLIIFALMGNLRAGTQITLRDLPSKPGASIEGIVDEIKKDNRVYLKDVHVEGGEALHRRALVTLMHGEDETEAPAVCVGQRIVGTGRLFAQEEKRNPGSVDRRVQALCEGYELSGYILPGWTAYGEGGFSVREAFRQIRLSLLKRIEDLFGDQSALFQGIMLGERSGLDAELTAALRLTGTAHILTVSGLHFSIIAIALSRLFALMPIYKGVRFALLVAILSIFMMLTDAAPGTVRACIMAIVREGAPMRGRKYDPLTALAFSALVMVIVQPLWILHASFQFSFVVVLGIQLLSGSLRKAFRRFLPDNRVGMALGDALSISVCAQTAALPMQLMLYGYVPLLSLPMNMLCSAFMSVALLGGWICLLASLLFPEMVSGIAEMLKIATAGFERLSVAVASLDGAIVRLPAPYGLWVIGFVVLLMLLSRKIGFGRLRKVVAFGIAILLMLTYLPRFDPSTRAVQLDVGQGDAAVLCMGREAILIDVGPSDSYEALRYLRHEGLFVRAVILSHLDEDHAGALASILRSEIRIPQIIIPTGALDDEVADTVISALELALEKKIPVREVQAGSKLFAGEIEVDVLSPTYAQAGSNERSLLLHVQTQGISLLYTGDLPSACEPVVLPKCDVLKVAHHGSKYASSDVFIEQTQPDIALISVGKNNAYGHPGKRVLDALKRAGVHVLRTDECGGITLRLQEGEIHVDTFLTPSLKTTSSIFTLRHILAQAKSAEE